MLVIGVAGIPTLLFYTAGEKECLFKGVGCDFLSFLFLWPAMHIMW
jgi:hypothetical protein